MRKSEINKDIIFDLYKTGVWIEIEDWYKNLGIESELRSVISMIDHFIQSDILKIRNSSKGIDIQMLEIVNKKLKGVYKEAAGYNNYIESIKIKYDREDSLEDIAVFKSIHYTAVIKIKLIELINMYKLLSVFEYDYTTFKSDAIHKLHPEQYFSMISNIRISLQENFIFMFENS